MTYQECDSMDKKTSAPKGSSRIIVTQDQDSTTIEADLGKQACFSLVQIGGSHNGPPRMEVTVADASRADLSHVSISMHQVADMVIGKWHTQHRTSGTVSTSRVREVTYKMMDGSRHTVTCFIRKSVDEAKGMEDRPWKGDRVQVVCPPPMNEGDWLNIPSGGVTILADDGKTAWEAKKDAEAAALARKKEAQGVQ